MFSFQDCTKSVFLDIQKKMNNIEKLSLLVRTLNTNNDDKEGKVCGVLTKFTGILTDFFFIIIGEKASTNLPLNKTYYLREIAKLTCLHGPMYLSLDDYPPYSDKQSNIFEAKINK